MNFWKKATGLDTAILLAFTVFITWQPYYLWGELNLFELGIYLPGINAILDGLVPFRDFFHLRGPMELYVPALMMRLFGERVGVLSTYFYAGTVATLLLYVLLAREVLRTRWMLYVMVPVFVGRTFPRVAFTLWGGMRYALGVLAILWFCYFLKTRRRIWACLAGVSTALALLTSAEVGVCALAGVGLSALVVWLRKDPVPIDRKFVWWYGAGLVGLLGGYFVYLWLTGSLAAYMDMTWAVLTRMTTVFPDRFLDDSLPQSFSDALAGMMPWHRNFKYLTPAYCYVFFLGYLGIKARRGEFKQVDPRIVAVLGYGLVMYLSAFRKIGGSQFEMALQPEKLLLFFLLEEAVVFLWRQRRAWSVWRRRGVYFLIFCLVGSSWGYALARFNHRFFAFQYVVAKGLGRDTAPLRPLYGQPAREVRLARLRGMRVPAQQADDLERLDAFIRRHSVGGEPVFMFPEIGAYSFIVDRPFVGRFPMMTFSWIGGWQEELLTDLRRTRPRFVVMDKDPGPTFEQAYFRTPGLRESYNQFMDYIRSSYREVYQTPFARVYQRIENGSKIYRSD